MLIVHQLAGVLLDMDALDPDAFRLGDPSLLVRLDRQRTFTDKRMIKLRNLVTLRPIGIEIILAVEARPFVDRSEEHTSELQSLMRISYAVFCLKKKKTQHRLRDTNTYTEHQT